MIFLCNTLHTPLDQILELDIMTFNELVDRAAEFDATQWRQRAWCARMAAHADADGFKKALDAVWGKGQAAPEATGAGGFADLMRDYSKGMIK